jgi:hypothetical protein
MLKTVPFKAPVSLVAFISGKISILSIVLSKSLGIIDL